MSPMPLQVWVMGFFDADRGGGAVACIYNSVVRQGHEPGLDAVDKHVAVAAKEVGPADTAGKEYVA